ncbi:hypothetical protein BMS3Bbin04_01553 [bacterium BMS3Bbin04]|nr:hypothetical protein BMS3Bbin04_01553 [bacterium BMS3Bbin04]
MDTESQPHTADTVIVIRAHSQRDHQSIGNKGAIVGTMNLHSRLQILSGAQGPNQWIAGRHIVAGGKIEPPVAGRTQPEGTSRHTSREFEGECIGGSAIVTLKDQPGFRQRTAGIHGDRNPAAGQGGQIPNSFRQVHRIETGISWRLYAHVQASDAWTTSYMHHHRIAAGLVVGSCPHGHIAFQAADLSDKAHGVR